MTNTSASASTLDRRSSEVDASDDVGPEHRRGPARSRADRVLLTFLALAVWALVLFLGRAWGQLLDLQGHQMILYTPPLLGSYRFGAPPALLFPVVVGCALVYALPRVSLVLPWRGVLAVGAGGALAWWVALALTDGPAGLLDGLEFEREYQPYVQAITPDPLRWLRGFEAIVPHAGVQVRAHPPLLPMVLGLMNRVGLGGAGWACALVLVVAASGVVAVMVSLREVVGEDTARRALPFLVLAPAALFIATSFDALYMGVAAWFVTAIVVATRREGPVAKRWAVAAGALAAVSVLLSYGMVLLGAVPLFLILRTGVRAVRPVLVAAGTALALIVALVPFGYWWLSGLGACRDAYYALGLDRDYRYFLFNNLSAMALVVGPAIAVAVVHARDRRLWLLPAGGLLAMAVADISGLSTGEVERIWLPFVVWVFPLAVVLTDRRGRVSRPWLCVQMACPLVLSLFIRPLW